MFRKISSILTIILFIYSVDSYARPPEEAEFFATSDLGESIAKWLAEDKSVTSVALFSTNSNDPLEGDIEKVLEGEIMKHLSKRGIREVSSCLECRTPKVTINGGEIIVSKGASDIQSIQQAGRKLATESLLVTEVYRTGIALVAQATLYSSPKGQILGSERFRANALSIGDASVQLLATVGSGISVFSQNASAPEGLTTGVNVSLLEEIGFGKGGLSVGAILAPGNTLIYVDPTISLRGRFGSSSLGWNLNLGLGYGILSDLKGINGRASYELILGSWAVVGAEGLYFFPDSTTSNSLKAYVGFHVGISIGR